MLECLLISCFIFTGADRAPSSSIPPYLAPKPTPIGMLDEFERLKREYESRPKPKNRLLEPPNNLSPGDNGGKLLDKFFMNRIDILQESLKDNSPQAMAIATGVDKISKQAVTIKSRMCDLKTMFSYDINRGTATTQAVCESYNIRTIYSAATNKYDSSVYVEYDRGGRVGVRVTDGTDFLVFLEGTW